MDGFFPGQDVRLAQQPSRHGVVVGGPRADSEGRAYEVLFLGERNRVWVPESRLEPASNAPMRWVTRRKFLRDLAVIKLTNPFSDVLYSMGASRTRFLVYQFQPVLKFVQSMPHGVLIADEVGLGKTIEAGLILKELIARGSVRRVLVICPANLRMKWRDEMQRRFGLQFTFVTSQSIHDIRRQVEYGGWPDFFGIASIEAIRREELQEVLQETGIQFDLVIVDEAHHMRNPATQSFDLGALLSDQADHILLLSATPVQTGAGDLLSLLQLIEPSQFRGTSTMELDELLEPNQFINSALRMLTQPDVAPTAIAEELRKVAGSALSRAFMNNQLFIRCVGILNTADKLTPETAAGIRRDLQRLHTLAPYYTRTRKREVEDSAIRRSRVIRVPIQDKEQRFYDAWVTYLTALAQARNPGISATWAISMRERQAASSLIVAKERLGELIRGDMSSEVESSEPDLPEVLIIRDVWGVEEYRIAAQEAAAELTDQDSKYDELRRLVTQLTEEKPNRKILLFTFFKGTLRYLVKRLQRDGVTCRAISGDDSPDTRADIIAQFKRSADERVLLSTEVGAEGIDLQFCDAVINYDLPWNPMRVEQRIGRIDRFGQQEPVVHVFSFFVEGTIDTRILERLYERINVFEESIGELEPILGPIVKELMADAFSGKLTLEEQEGRENDALHRVENLRQQQQEFEQARAELLGQGDLIRQQVQSLRQSGRYLTQGELHALVGEWLDSSPPAYESLEPTRREGAWVLRMSSDRVGRIFGWINQARHQDPAVRLFLQRILDRGSAWCTFDTDMAQEFGELAFIDVGHPIVQSALEDSGALPPARPFERVGRLRVPGNEAWPPTVVLYLYALDLRGAEPQTTLVPVAVNLDDGSVIEQLGDEALGLIDKGDDIALDEQASPELLEELEASAYRWADARRSETEQWAAETQAARLATRRTTLERSYHARIERKEALAGRVFEPRIRRLHEGEIRNLRAVLEAKLHEIEDTPEPVATLSLIAVCVLTPNGSGAPAMTRALADQAVT